MIINDPQDRDMAAFWEDFRTKLTCSVASALLEYDYAAVLARRNLNHLFASGKTVLDEPGARERLMTDNGLLLQHNKIAEFYRKEQQFPPIWVSDDVLVHGRSLSRLFQDLWTLLLADLQRDGLLSDDEVYDAHRSFLQALRIQVYARNKRRIILEDSYRRRLSTQQIFYTAELREFAGVSCDALYASEEVANTSYVFSSLLPGMTDAPEGWERSEWIFEEKFRTLEKESQTKTMTVYVRQPGKSPRWISTIRHKGLADSSGKRRLVTSLVLFGQLPEEAVHSACAQAAALLEDAHCPALKDILQQKQLEQIRMQLLSFFASVITFFDFGQGLCPDVEQVLANSDLDKISLNFGPYNEIYPELCVVCRDAGLRESLREIVFACLEKGTVLELPPLRPLDSQQMEAMTESGKAIMGRLGAESEAAAYNMSHSSRHSQKAGQIPFEEYLEWVRKEQPSSGWLSEIAALLFLMENGVMNMYICSESMDGTISCMVKAGEKATYSLAEPISVELPALALVERECWRMNLPSKEALERFIPLLTQETGLKLDKESQQRLLDACNNLYQCGHTLTGWDFEAITEQQDYKKKEQQRSYFAQAKAFLHMS